MSHENALATILVATRCACCGLSLVDATSVELGIGPVCRKSHGFTTADAPPDWFAVARALLSGQDALIAQAVSGDVDAQEVLQDSLLVNLPELEHVRSLWLKDSRTVANAFVHRAAIVQLSDLAVFTKCVSAIDALGFKKLASRMAKYASAIEVVRVEGSSKIGVFLPRYSAEFVARAKNIGGRATKVTERTWRWDFPVTSRASLWAALKEVYPAGTPVHGPKGVSAL